MTDYVLVIDTSDNVSWQVRTTTMPPYEALSCTRTGDVVSWETVYPAPGIYGVIVTDDAADAPAWFP